MPAIFGALTVGRQVSLRNSVKNDSQISLKNLSTLVLLPQSRRLRGGQSSLIPGHFHTRMRDKSAGRTRVFSLADGHALPKTDYITHRGELSLFVS